MHNRAFIWILLIAGPCGLLLFGISDRGLVGPDEPRYASIAREMARSGDWVTPRLAGEPWFEKPALVYWLGGVFIRLGFDDDRATRLPVALISLAFLVFFYRRLKQHFGEAAAGYATLILATSAGWAAYGQIGTPDLPLAASFAAALLVLLPWVGDAGATNSGTTDSGARAAEDTSAGGFPLFGFFLGISVLAKGLVGPLLAALALLPVCWDRGPREVMRALAHPRTWAPFTAVVLPWYGLCYLANGSIFLEEFIWRHHVMRFFSSSLEHVQPFWFFAPVMLGALLPWTILLPIIFGKQLLRDRRFRFLLCSALSTVAVFSVSTNKLPGYILPALPALAACLGIGLARAEKLRLPLAISAMLPMLLVPLTTSLLPAALSHGIRRAWAGLQLPWGWGLAAVVLGGAVYWAASRNRRSLAVALAAAATFVSLISVKTATFPLIDQHAGTRSLWRQVQPRLEETCLGEVRRHVRYGLAYYSSDRLPPCSESPRMYQIAHDPPRMVRSSR